MSYCCDVLPVPTRRALPYAECHKTVGLVFPFQPFPFLLFNLFPLYFPLSIFNFQFSIFNFQLPTSFLLFRHTWYELTMFCHSTYVPGPTDESGFK